MDYRTLPNYHRQRQRHPQGLGAQHPNTYNPENDRYILDLLKRIIRVSLETVKIVNELPPLEER
jgi:predicted helicase